MRYEDTLALIDPIHKIWTEVPTGLVLVVGFSLIVFRLQSAATSTSELPTNSTSDPNQARFETMATTAATNAVYQVVNKKTGRQRAGNIRTICR